MWVFPISGDTHMHAVYSAAYITSLNVILNLGVTHSSTHHDYYHCLTQYFQPCMLMC
jgi:hypothetical protein